MTGNSPQQVRRLFLELAELPEAERAAALALACGNDAALRAQVEALLKADAEAGGFMESPTAGGIQATAAQPLQERAGALIGRYKLLEQIGEGGMGTIWMAEQREPVKRRVALKIIKLGMDTKQVIARFEAERQALALMDHPHIAKVLDAGATDTGRPYFVMEYIKGIPILEYCDKERLDTTARLELFASVCHAIQHAHQKGIIHRDIKPSNVLVTLHDGTPVPKVIDFGIAKATNSELTAKTLFTEHRQLIGTPAYMSPEQAEMSGLDIDTRSDVYSLGVLLYELLTGTTPFDTKALLESGYHEMLRAIREDEPHKPSTRISTLGDTGTRTAQQRQVDLKKLGALLRGDLDWIVMKCLEKDRTRRYETANGLAADIKRHLSDEPVSAGAPSAGYKLRKLAKRNRAHVFAGCAVIAALLIGVVAFAWQAKEARHQRDLAVQAKNSEAEQHRIAAAARNEAETQANKAKEQEAEARTQAAVAQRQETEAKTQSAIAVAVAKFQTDMLAAADPQALLGDKVTVLQVLEAAVKELDQGSLAEQPRVEAEVRDTIGRTLIALARYDLAEHNQRKALEIVRAELPAGCANLVPYVNNLAESLHHQNELAEAETLFREALEILRAADPGWRLLLATCAGNLGMLLSKQNRFDEAEPLLREALDIMRAELPAGHVRVANCLNNLAAFLCSQHRLPEAEPLYREALGIMRAAYPAGHPLIANTLSNLAALCGDQDKLAEAELLHREALGIRRTVLPAGHPGIAISLNNLASHLRSRGKLDEAESMNREALAIQRAKFPGGHPDLAATMNNLAVLLDDRHELAEAEALYREALDVRRAVLPAGHPSIADSLYSLGHFLKDRNELTEAEPLFREALDITRAAGPAGRKNLKEILDNLGGLLLAQKKFAEAASLVGEAMEIRRASLPAGHPDMATGLYNLSALRFAEHKFAEAEALAREALEIRRVALPVGHRDIAASLSALAKSLSRQGKLAEAESLLREALEIQRKILPAGDPERHVSTRDLADLLVMQGKIDQTEPLLRELLESERATLPKDSPELAARLAQLGFLLLTREAWDDAEPLLREALAIRETQEPGEWRTFNTRSLLGGALLGQKKLVEAEPLLLDGYRGMKARETSMLPVTASRITEALERLVQLYESKGDASEAAAWRSKLEAARATAAAGGSKGGR